MNTKITKNNPFANIYHKFLVIFDKKFFVPLRVTS